MLRLACRRSRPATLLNKTIRHGEVKRQFAPICMRGTQHCRSLFGMFKAENKPEVKKTSFDEQPNQLNASTQVNCGDNGGIEYSIGKYAKLADGSVMAKWGNSMVLTTVVSEKSVDPSSSDFLPLMVDYREKYASTGTIPGSVKRREMAGTDAEVLKSRIIDRIVRPLFPRGYNSETQIISTVQSYDVNHDPVVLAVNSTSAALWTSNIPWNGPIGCVRVVKVKDQLIHNPTAEEMKAATLDVLYAATAHRTLMIEAEGHEIDELELQQALQLAHKEAQAIIESQLLLPQKPKRDFKPPVVPEDIVQFANGLLPEVRAQLSSLEIPNSKKQRQSLEGKTYDFVKTKIVEAFPNHHKDDIIVNIASHDLVQHALRANALEGVRLDGRDATTIRPLQMETTVLPSVHGSSLFSRGDTQALCTVTLGHLDSALRVRSALSDNENYETKHAFLQYEFPPFCVNETGKLGGPNRRMLGHGALAEKAILPVIPQISNFPFTIRMTSETLGSDGSSSMATVCGVSLALLDAGVPMKTPVAGISVGLVSGGDLYDGVTPIQDYRLLTDILGTEDHYGDMDFKIAGTANGVTAVQLDVKLPGVPLEILCEGIEQARVARHQILNEMNNVRSQPRELNQSKVSNSTYMTIDPAMRGALIGAGGANIRDLETQSNCSIQCKEDGLVEINGNNEEDIQLAKQLVEQTTFMYRRNQRYKVIVQNVMDFGCMVVPAFAYGTPLALEKSKQAFLHVSEMAHTPVKRASAAVQVGQSLECWCIFAERDATKLSIKALFDPKTNKGLSDEEAEKQLTAREEALKRVRMT